MRADLPPPPQTNPPALKPDSTNRFCFVIRTCSPVLPISTSPIRTGEKYGLETLTYKDIVSRTCDLQFILRVKQANHAPGGAPS